MRYTSRGVVLLLVGSLVLCGAPSGASASGARAASPGRPLKGTVSGVKQAAGGGVEEREQGRALLRRGRASEALVHLERALKVFEAAGDRAGEASAHDLLGELYERQGRYDIARDHYRKAHDLYAAAAAGGGSVRPPVAAAAVAAAAALTTEESAYNAQLMLAKTGNMLYRSGDLNGARDTYEQMRVKPPDTGALGKMKRSTGVASGVAGSIFGRGKPSVQISAPTLGSLFTLKQQLDLYRQSILYANYELGLGRVDYQGEQLDSARKHFQNVLDATKGDLPFLGQLGQSRRYRIAARTSLGDIAFRQGRYKNALDLYADAAKGAKEDKRLDLAWPAHRGKGRSLWAQAEQEAKPEKASKMRKDALAAYGEALAVIEKIRQGSLRADESRTSFLATTSEVFEEAAGVLAEMALGVGVALATSARLEGDALAYATQALNVVEQGRARSLLDLLSETGSEITEGVSADLLKQRRENQSRQEEIAALLTGVAVAGADTKKSPEDLEEELEKLQEVFESIENQIRTANPRYDKLISARPLALADIRQQVLDDETALLVYSLGEERSHLFAVTRDALTVSRLPARAEIERQVVALRQQIVPAKLRRKLTDLVAGDALRGLTVTRTDAADSPAAVNAYATAAGTLYKTLVEPATPLVKTNRLLIVADGALNYIPFHALVTAAPPADADFSTLPYLLRTNETVLAPSASVVAAIRAQRGAGGGGGAGGMLLVADPVFDARDTRASGAGATAQNGAPGATRALGVDSALSDIAEAEATALSAPSSPDRGVLVRLTGTRAEAQQIARLAATAGRKADTWLDLDASEANVESRDLRQYRVLHFATHGLLNTKRPQFTGVVLSLVGNAAGEDGFLRTDEVFNLRLGSPLVMLSACETGLGKEKRGEGVIGLTRAFMYAGAPTVGVSLWSVADKSTADLMTDFYRQLLGGQGMPPTAAMRAARLQMIAGKKYSAPFYWAPFVLVGDWR